MFFSPWKKLVMQRPVKIHKCSHCFFLKIVDRQNLWLWGSLWSCIAPGNIPFWPLGTSTFSSIIRHTASHHKESQIRGDRLVSQRMALNLSKGKPPPFRKRFFRQIPGWWHVIPMTDMWTQVAYLAYYWESQEGRPQSLCFLPPIAVVH